ncbi:proteasome assembly chaperone 1-like [Ciona intestinalis]
MKIHTVSACCSNNGIGFKGSLPWSLPTEFAYFVRLSTGNPPPGKRNVVILGRRTWDSKPHARLNRINVVLSRSDKPIQNRNEKPNFVAHSLEEAVTMLESAEWKDKIHEVFAIGGHDIYKLVHDSPYCGTVYLTRVEAEFQSDTFYPKLDDSFELLPTERPPVYKWKGEMKATKFDNFVFGFGAVATGFIESYCLTNDKLKEVGKLIEVIDSEATGTKAKEQCILRVYTDDNTNKTMFCTSKAYVASHKIWPLQQEIFSKFEIDQSASVVVLDSAPIHDFKTHDCDIITPVVRSLRTNSSNKSNAFPILERPNLVKGVSAAILTICELQSIQAELCVCYTATFEIDFASIQAFCPLLDKDVFSTIEKNNPNSIPRIKTLLANQGSTQSLYT